MNGEADAGAAGPDRRPPFLERDSGAMSEGISGRRSAWRAVTAWYAAVLSWILGIATAILVIPVTLQVFSRFTALLPHYIWTEEMARFLLVWTIMIGAMIGVRESTHFEVDLWPRLSRRAEAAVQLIARLGVLIVALVFVWSGIEFTQFAWYRISELAELPLWLIHHRLADHRRDLAHLPRRADVGRVNILLGRGPRRLTGGVLSPVRPR